MILSVLLIFLLLFSIIINIASLFLCDTGKVAIDLLHKCGKYSGSYIIHTDLLRNHSIKYNLTVANLELGTHILTNNRIILQSTDMLDFSVIHLSGYDKLLGNYMLHRKDFNYINIANNLLQAEAIKTNDSVNITRKSLLKPCIDSDFDDTIVIIPYGFHSDNIRERGKRYLTACFWSFYKTYRNIVVFVAALSDYEYLKNNSKLPFYEIIFLENLPFSWSLPLASVQYTKDKLLSSSWGHFKFMLFTESDMILISRIPNAIYHHLHNNRYEIIMPHRLTPYPNQVMSDILVRDLPSKKYGVNDWLKMKCCYDSHYIHSCRKRIAISSTNELFTGDNVSVISIYGLSIPMGNQNIYKNIFTHVCKLYEFSDERCSAIY